MPNSKWTQRSIAGGGFACEPRNLRGALGLLARSSSHCAVLDVARSLVNAEGGWQLRRSRAVVLSVEVFFALVTNRQNENVIVTNFEDGHIAIVAE